MQDNGIMKIKEAREMKSKTLRWHHKTMGNTNKDND